MKSFKQPTKAKYINPTKNPQSNPNRIISYPWVKEILFPSYDVLNIFFLNAKSIGEQNAPILLTSGWVSYELTIALQLALSLIFLLHEIVSPAFGHYFKQNRPDCTFKGFKKYIKG